MNKRKYSLVGTATTNTQKHIDIIAKEVLDQEKKNNSNEDIEEEDIMQT